MLHHQGNRHWMDVPAFAVITLFVVLVAGCDTGPPGRSDFDVTAHGSIRYVDGTPVSKRPVVIWTVKGSAEGIETLTLSSPSTTEDGTYAAAFRLEDSSRCGFYLAVRLPSPVPTMEWLGFPIMGYGPYSPHVDCGSGGTIRHDLVVPCVEGSSTCELLGTCECASPSGG